MKCFNCGADLKDSEYCSQCGADVKLYSRMLKLSNAYYNEGLEKAKVRDLSGAVLALRESLKINKKNTNARNLLGLVYYEMGMAVEALTQWIISRSFQSSKNIADEYIESIQNNPARLDTVNTSLRKYNQALVYCQQGSYDLAIIQLKKVLSVNGKLLDAHLLLALLYMKVENYARARNEIKKVLAVDCNNTQALRYLKELNQETDKDQPKEEEKNKDYIAYTRDNETIIQPVGVKDNSGFHAILNVVIGLVIGVAVMGLLIMPALQSKKSGELNKAVAEYSDQVDAKSATLDSLKQENESLKQQAEEATKAASDAADKVSSYEELLKAYASYSAGDSAAALQELEAINQDTLSDDAKTLYSSVFSEVGVTAVNDLYKTGYAAYEKGDYDTAIADLGKCYELDNTQGDALYFLARSYHKSGDTENAKIYYQKVIEEFPNTRKATDAEGLMKGL
ncbi:MAG: tetratricopeptide repeat protein [Lachnospiraceae bacterium]|uniref:Tetratricopeptide repeat protein n=1 Tax=Hominiventricola filiformis TaxID=2885352 RepID=A0AAE3A5B0_9FIRM|nr:tetratricopeptide repeat protein [Hominiventricola filiformis]MCC2126302.1 tetratricopeptide repeat protein [Hominiventricola filiformis]MCI6880055.1 tetratricopeptide repeat protein [Clostridiaceae bacterium]MDY3825448.1 tetratricopeptide repeat protein [Lachnospiraceae bacterium]